MESDQPDKQAAVNEAQRIFERQKLLRKARKYGIYAKRFDQLHTLIDQAQEDLGSELNPEPIAQLHSVMLPIGSERWLIGLTLISNEVNIKAGKDIFNKVVSDLFPEANKVVSFFSELNAMADHNAQVLEKLDN